MSTLPKMFHWFLRQKRYTFSSTKKIKYLCFCLRQVVVLGPLWRSRGGPPTLRAPAAHCALQSPPPPAQPRPLGVTWCWRGERERDSTDTHTQKHTHIDTESHTLSFFFQPCCVSTNGTSLNLQDISRLFSRLHVNISTRTEVSADI